jgi:2-methylcitrate dehydratase PrpD
MTIISPTTSSEHIAQFTTSFDPEQVSADAKTEPASRIALRYVQNNDSCTAQARLWGLSDACSVSGAAFYNGVAAHVLDFDDVSSPLRGHPSVVMLPALLALGQARSCSGRRLASAYVVGLEVMVKIARAMVSDHYTKGWHATTTLGLIGAVAACSHLVGLAATLTAHAIGLAFAQASGSRANFGTMAKSFQTGHCNASALRAVLLAEAGMDASLEALDGTQGFTKLYGNGESLRAELETLGAAPLEILNSGLEIKKYPMCYAAHRAIDGVLDLCREHAIDAATIASIHVLSNRRAMVPLIHPYATTGLEAKFSMPYAMAAAVLDHGVRLASFTDQAVQRPEIQALMKKISTEESDGPVTPRWNVVTITLHNGIVHEKEIRVLRGAHDKPLTDDDVLAKWQDCLQYGGFSYLGQQFFEDALNLGTTDIPSLMARLPAARTQV